MRKERKKILISGEAKTGTTAIYFAVKNALPHFESHFEPSVEDTNNFLKNDTKDIIVKSIIGTIKDNDICSAGYFDKFDKRIFIVRDPRDKIISTLLYIGGFHRVFREPAKIRSSIELLQQKENDNSISLLKIWTHIFRKKEDLANFLSQNMMRDVANNYDHCLLKYESFIDGDVQDVCDYLGVDSLNNNVDVEDFHRVSRTKSYGNWKNWFTDEDIEFFRPLVEPYFNRFNYEDDWQVNEKPFIDSKFCSQYFIDRVDEQRRNSKMPDWRNL